MLRTNIYLGEDQSAALDKMARTQAITRAELIRRFIDAGLGGSGTTDLEADLAAIRDSFGVLRNEEIHFARGRDERDRHLARVAGRDPRR